MQRISEGSKYASHWSKHPSSESGALLSSHPPWFLGLGGHCTSPSVICQGPYRLLSSTLSLWGCGNRGPERSEKTCQGWHMSGSTEIRTEIRSSWCQLQDGIGWTRCTTTGRGSVTALQVVRKPGPGTLLRRSHEPKQRSNKQRQHQKAGEMASGSSNPQQREGSTMPQKPAGTSGSTPKERKTGA